MDWIKTAETVVEGLEKAKGYWDAKGLDMHIAILENENRKSIAVSTKHWPRVHYLRMKDVEVSELIDVLKTICEEVGRSVISSVQGPYVYIPKLNMVQTQDIFNKIQKELKDREITFRIIRLWQMSWDIEDAVKIDN